MNFRSAFHLSMISLSLGIGGLEARAQPLRPAFVAVSAGDVTDTASIIWTQIGYADGTIQTSAPAELLKAEVATDPAFFRIIFTSSASTDPNNGNSAKFLVGKLAANTRYYYRFSVTRNGVIYRSQTGKFTTNPDRTTAAPFAIGFSGDYDAKYRPYALLNNFGAQGGSIGLRQFVNLGDIIYETNAKGSEALPGAKGSPEEKAGNELTPLSPALTKPDLNRFYRKYLEEATGVNSATGQLSVLPALQQGVKNMLASQGVYTLLDNHELYNAMISGGASKYSIKENYLDGETDPAYQPPPDSQCFAMESPLPLVPPPAPKTRWIRCLKDAGANAGASFVNRSNSFQAMIKAFYNTQATSINLNGLPGALTPVNLLGATPTIQAPDDPRTNGTVQNYFARPWGANIRYIQLDDRSYRDARMVNVSPIVANDPRRTMLGKTQLAWFKQQLLDARDAGVKWKIVALSTPIDIWVDFSTKALDNKSWVGGYNYERNDIMKFIADNGVKNVVFLTTDDHLSRATKLTYQPAGAKAGNPWVEVPYTIQILAGPAGAVGPYQNAMDPNYNGFGIDASRKILNAYDKEITKNGAPPIGLMGYPGLSVLYREGDPNAARAPQGVDFLHGTSFNYVSIAWDANAKMTVSYWGVDAYAPDAYPAPCATLLSANCVRPPRKLIEFALVPTNP
ncbi:alkaline phosphatase D family protein [Methylocystis sp. IM3]|uniref:alkaline phosphatase D family protein n=1 Tax=unclassified Methylocystis TaxID=2625913 RepID=UPI0031191E6E